MIEGCNCGQQPSRLQSGNYIGLKCNYCNRYIPAQPSQEQAVIAWNSMILENRMQIIARRKEGEFLRFSSLPTPDMIKEINKDLQEIANCSWEELKSETSPFYLMYWIEEIQCKLIAMDKISTKRIGDFIDQAQAGELFPPDAKMVSVGAAFSILGQHFENMQKSFAIMMENFGTKDA